MMCAMARLGRSSRSLGITLVALALAGTALTACGGSSSDSGGAGTSSAGATGATGLAGATAPGQPSGYPPVPSGVSLTAPGSTLRLGQSATVAWKPTQKLTGVLDVTVTGVYSTTFKQSFKGWELDDATKANAPYFVTATVRNAGRGDLSGQRVPLYGSATSGALVEASSFASGFKPCQPDVLPTPFPAGANTNVCLVYLVPNGGALDGVSFRPSESFDPITWSGDVTSLPKGKKGPGTGPTPTRAPSLSAPASRSGSAQPHMSGSPVR